MRICLFSGPGGGKSTLAARIFYELKIEGYSIELVREYIKKWAYEDRKPTSFDQSYIFGHQMHSEDLPLRNGIKNIVVDSPLIMNVCYGKRYNYPLWESLLEQAIVFEKKYPSFNIFLDRTGLDYQEIGRYENYEQALWMDGQIKNFMDEHLDSYSIFHTKDINGILSVVKEKISL